MSRLSNALDAYHTAQNDADTFKRQRDGARRDVKAAVELLRKAQESLANHDTALMREIAEFLGEANEQ